MIQAFKVVERAEGKAIYIDIVGPGNECVATYHNGHTASGMSCYKLAEMEAEAMNLRHREDRAITDIKRMVGEFGLAGLLQRVSNDALMRKDNTDTGWAWFQAGKNLSAFAGRLPNELR